MSWLLLISMAERMGFIVAIAFLFTRWTGFRSLLEHKPSLKNKLVLAVIFGLFGITGTYTGITVSPGEVQHQFPGSLSYEDAIANSRAIGVIVAGLLGGLPAGLGAGLIAGIHRMSLGGFTDIACGISTVYEGLLAGLVYYRMRQHTVISPGVALATGIAGELGQMAIILLVANPFYKALALVKIIAVPMIVANSFGIALFIAIVLTVLERERAIGAVQAQKALAIADKTLAHLRTGLNYDSALVAARIIYEESGAGAVAITDDRVILAHVGEGANHHLSGTPILTEVTRQVLEQGQLKTASNPSEILCKNLDCPLQSAIVVPLHSGKKVIGTLKLYSVKRRKPDKLMVELAGGLAHLFSTQLELGEAEQQAKLLQNAEIKALQAQINPHFLFNALNTVVSLIRTNPDEARRVLIELGNYIRQNLKSSLCKWTSLETEIKHVQAYLAVVQARFSNRLKVIIDVPHSLHDIALPPLTLQPLVENAVRHGFAKITPQSAVMVKAVEQGDDVLITVQDNGVGMARAKIEDLLDEDKRQNTDGIGLINVHSRLTGVFGQEYGLSIASTPHEGTTVQFKIPLTTQKGVG
ncbi:two-component system, LytT family, sensor histidine kinase LytS [Desulfotomaculum arcticum]|uniref:histidine kinase n=1 Tax=Desulfotruncus arcticus DSM 17038 TaxID=1121424 RepID=A0A1I2RFR3_9FIRM|nr:sensor histidine kinase [Desulfotruncus arcticus]SFG39270.1 two-component system, LytT family, sensor histidine kinase LytS [Desulfotomaculum arcticum] [Desulfotruncus arcticus DSM 17038]